MMGVGFLSLLTLVFVAAKLFGYIDWSWFLVLLPAIISLLIKILLVILIFAARASRRYR